MKLQTLSTRQGTWSYSVTGKGEKALLFIHGASSSNKIWKNQFDLSVEEHKCLFVDMLGYGQSSKPASGYSLTEWLAGLHQILQREKIEKVAIVAHSNGVIFAKEYYRAYPRQVSQLILLDGMLKPMISESMLVWMRKTLERDNYEEYMANNVKMMPVQDLDEADAELLRNDGLNTPKAVSAAELALVSNANTWRPLTVHCPVTVIHSNNPMWTPDYLAWLPEVAPQLDLHHWEDAGHFIQLQYPERLNILIKQLLTHH